MSNKKSTYYERNREGILIKTRLKYKTDPEFRALHNKRVKRYKQKKAAERRELKQKLKYEKSIWREFAIGDVIIPCCRVGYVAKSIDRTVQTLRLWERNSFLPNTIRYKKQRYYAKYHYILILRMWRSHLDNHTNISLFFRDVWDNWDKEKEEWINKKN